VVTLAYFQNAVLPNDVELDAALMGKHTKKCKICGKGFLPNGKQTYCSEKCQITGKRQATAARVKRHRISKHGM